MDQQRSPIALLSVSVEGTEGRLIAVFTLSAAPTRAWILAFLERARYSVFEVTGARFARNRIRIQLPRREDLEALTRSVEQFIEGANVEHRATSAAGV